MQSPAVRAIRPPWARTDRLRAITAERSAEAPSHRAWSDITGLTPCHAAHPLKRVDFQRHDGYPKEVTARIAIVPCTALEYPALAQTGWRPGRAVPADGPISVAAEQCGTVGVKWTLIRLRGSSTSISSSLCANEKVPAQMWSWVCACACGRTWPRSTAPRSERARDPVSRGLCLHNAQCPRTCDSVRECADRP
jgi:hypothetical protein